MERATPSTCRIWVAGAAAGLILALAAAGSGRALPTVDDSDRAVLLELLRHDEFARLEAHWTALHDARRNGGGSDAALAHGFQTFASADPELLARLDRWVSRYPRSHAARVARAVYLAHLARIGRRGANRDRLEDPGGAPARGYFQRAQGDLEAALERLPSLGVAHAFLIDLAAATGSLDDVERHMREGLAADPESVTVRRSYLMALRPWLWPNADSAHLLTAIEDFAGRIAEEAETRPALRPLAGFRAFMTAELLRRQRRHVQAAEQYAEALAAGADRAYLRQQGLNAFAQGRFLEARQSFDRALARWPQDAALLAWRARALAALGNLEAALLDWRRALALDPWNPAILLQQAAALSGLQRYAEAEAALARAVHYGGQNARIRAARGRLLLHALDRPNAAAEELQRGVALAPHDPDLRREHALALLRSKQCDAAADALAGFQRLCANGVRCAPESTRWAAAAIAETRDPDACPVYGILGP